MITSCKFKIALDAGILHTLEKGTLEEIQNIFENNPQACISLSPQTIFETLKKYPEIVQDNSTLTQLFWSKTDFHPQILELIFHANPQLFVDEFEENLIFYLGLTEVEIGNPRILQFCAFSQSAYEKMLQILVTYADETDFDIRMCSLISELVTKVNLASENPIALQKPHLKPLITLLLVPPKLKNFKLCQEILHLWTDLFFQYPIDAKNLCLFYLPWFKCILRTFPNFQTFLDLK